MRRFSALTSLLFAAMAAGCLEPRRYASTPQAPPACRAGITAEGRPAPVEWTVTESGDRHVLDDWCRTCGPAVVIQPAQVQPPHFADELIIASWNVDVGGGDLDALLDRLGDAAHGERPVVVLLQEAYRDGPALPPLHAGAPVPHRIAPAPPAGARRSVVDVARRRGLSLFYVPSMRNG